MTFAAGKKAESSVSTPGDGLEIDAENEVLLPQPEDEGGQSGQRHTDQKLQTKLTSETLQHRLLEMYYDARTFIEEQGVNILYLVLGQLRWFDRNQPDKERFAPLILVPVTLTRKSAADRFHLSWLQEDAAENLSLAAKLKTDFGILLPEFKMGDDFSPAEYLEAVREVIKVQPQWGVVENAITLGFFSFSKFLMYRDLDPANWPAGNEIDKRKLVVSVLQEGFNEPEQLFSEDERVDAVVQVDSQRHVVDADSSQTLAAETIRRGANLVLQGPPGTGKSQTITNIIAAAVADGKKVLFVSEKMAALEVVYRRLTSVGLAAVCLELHSNRTNKRKVLEEFKATKDLGRPRVELRDQVVEQLTSVRDHLNEHAATMHLRVEPSGLTPYAVIGNLARLAQVSLTELPNLTPGAETWTPADFAERSRVVKELVAKAEKVPRPGVHPWRGVGHSAVSKLDADVWLASVRRLADSLEKLERSAAQLSSKLSTAPATTSQALQRQMGVAEKISKAPLLDRGTIAKSVWEAGFQRLATLVKQGQKFSDGRKDLQRDFLESAWNQDFHQLRRVIAERGDSLFRIFSGEYRAAVRTIKGQLRTQLSPTTQQRLSLLDTLIESIELRAELAKQDELGRDAFGSLWAGEESDWSHLIAVVEWMKGSNGQVISNQFRQLYSQLPAPEEAVGAATQCSADLQAARVHLGQIVSDYKLDCKVAFEQESVETVEFSAIKARIGEWLEQPSTLFDWAQFMFARQAMLRAGLAPLLEIFEGARIGRADLVRFFERSYYECVYRALGTRNQALIGFDGEQHSRHVEKFKALDGRRIDVARAETALAHYEAIPRIAAGIGPLAVLNGEIARKRGHMPLRRLFRQAAPAVQAIKPVFMMSPLSVAQFLEPGAIEFDLLVIDEASQIEPVDALGAIARCKQMVVVGDDRQLPPTRFFSRMTSETEVEDEDDEAYIAGASDVESILSLCRAKGMSEKMLRWHYRSRHQSLIAVSNQEFYKNNLFIVPSPITAAGNLGLRFNHIKNGVFDTGGTRVNREEAKSIANAIIAHAKNSPQHSLGVASFSLQQKIAIQDELELLRRQHPETETFFTDHPTEPFFIKNLENVQGDERDVMFISVAYARNASGYLPMRFGPVGADGGERRLNVLISRAKLRCEVFSSITADDIDLERARGKGVAALKVFLRYAQTGQLSIANRTQREADSSLEVSVKEALEQQGLIVHPQVGLAGFFIDLAILDQSNPGRYVLGIEVDGDSYHESRSARDRDRLRQSVLEDHGWILHRLWVSDWFRQPDVELAKIMNAIEAAKVELKARDDQDSALAKKKAVQFEFVDRDSGTDITVSFEESKTIAYREALFDVPRQKELHEVPSYRLAEFVNRIIQEEGPIHIDEVVTRLRSLWGLKRAGDRIRDAIERSVDHLVSDRTVIRSGSFIDRASRPVSPRDRSNVVSQTLKKADYLPPAEIQAAIKAVLGLSLGGRKEEIPHAVSKMLGLNMLTAPVKDAIESEIDGLHRSSELELRNDTYRLRS